MIEVFGKIRTLIYLLSPIDNFEVESTVTHQKSDIEFEEVAVGNLYYVYTMDFKNLDYGEYQYRAYLEENLQETGILKVCHEIPETVPEEEPNIVMYDGREDSES